jgi:predicted nuclease with TOPRIM domain
MSLNPIRNPPVSTVGRFKKMAKLIDSFCKALGCERNELESKLETFQKEREQELSNLKKENARLAGELKKGSEIVADLREQIRVLKEAMEEEETLL